jgi:FAD/FMN-containing dehydrogenase
MTSQLGQPDPGHRPSTQLQALRLAMRGDVIEPGEPAYEDGRKVFNANIDRRPALIARCCDVTDVLEAIRYAREHDMGVAVRGGGHNVAGLGTCDDDVVIDLSPMRGVRVDPRQRTVHVQGGATIRDLDHATQPFKLAVPMGIVSSTGVGGLTLGGGFGHLSRQFGLSCDNLISADVVTAAGELLVADRSHHPDLFWAIRGGGGNFGVVTSLEFRAHPVGAVFGGPIFWPMEAASELFRRYDDFIRRAPEQFSALMNYHVIPPVEPFPPAHHFETMCGMIVCFNGPEAEAREVLAPLLSTIAPRLDLSRMMPYAALQCLFDDLTPPGRHHYWKGLFLRELPQEVIDVHCKYGPKVPNVHSLMHMYPLNGAVHRVGPRETAFNFRDVNYVVNIVGVADTADQLVPIRRWVRKYWDKLMPNSIGGGYVNFLMGDELEQMTRAVYGDNFDLLVSIKEEYDPTNLFRYNHNIRPRAKSNSPS